MSIITEEVCRATIQKINDVLGEAWESEEYIDCPVNTDIGKTDCTSCALEIDNMPLYNELFGLFAEENDTMAVAYSRGAVELTLDEGAEITISGDIPLDERASKTKKKMDLLEKACGGLEDVHEHPPAVHVHIDNCPLDKFLKVAKKL